MSDGNCEHCRHTSQEAQSGRLLMDKKEIATPITPEAASEVWWKSFPERFGHQKNHAKVGWVAGWKQGRAAGLREALADHCAYRQTGDIACGWDIRRAAVGET